MLEIVKRGARVMQVAVSEDGAREIAKRARGTPRIAGRLLRRVRDFASVAKAEVIDRGVADRALDGSSTSTIAGSMRSTTATSPASP